MLNYLKNWKIPFSEDRLFGVIFFTVLIVPLAFNFYLYEKFEVVKFSIWLVLTGIGLGCFVFASATIKRFSNKAKIFPVFLGVFVLLSTIFSPNIINSVFGSYPRIANGFAFYFLFSVFLILLFTNLDQLRWVVLLKAIFFSSVVISLVGILQSMGVGYYAGLSSDFFSRAPSLLGNANFSSMYLVSVLPFALPLFLQAKTFASKIYYGVGAFLVFATILLLSSRGAWLALIVSMVFGILLLGLSKLSSKKILIALFIFGLVLGAWFTQAGFVRPDFWKNTVSLKEVNIQQRLFVWDIAVTAISSNPFLGVGPGNFHEYFQSQREKNLSEPGVFDDVHNIYLQMGSSIGLPFLATFVVFIFFGMFIAGRKFFSFGQDMFLWASLTGVTAWLVAGAFTPVATACFLVLGIMVVGFYLQYSVEKNDNFKGITKFLFGFGAVIFVSFGVLYILAEAFYYRGYVLFKQNKFAESKQMLNISSKINPFAQRYLVFKTANEIILGEPDDYVQLQIKKIINLHPMDAKSFISAAKLNFLMYERSNDIAFVDQGIDYLDRAVSLDKNNYQVYILNGFYRAQSADLDSGLNYVKFGVSLFPKDPSSWLILARIYQLQGKAEQALYAVENAFKLLPTNYELKFLTQELKKRPENLKKILIPAAIDTLSFE